MSAAPPISVILPVRDALPTLDAALASLCAQTCGDFELLAVDDGSRDGSSERLAAWAARDSRVRVIPVPASRGDLVAALRRACAAARGEFLARMDADDLAHPERFARQVALIQSDPRLGAVGCLVRSFPELSVHGGRLRYDRWLNRLRSPHELLAERFVESPLAHPSVLLRASAYRALGGYRSFAGPEDYDLWLRLFAAGWSAEKVPALLHFWRERPERLSRVDPRYCRAAMARVRAQALALHLGARPAVIAGAGQAGRRLARGLLAAGARVRCFLDVDPRKLGREPHGVPVLDLETGLARRGDALVLSCVNAWGRRADVRAWFEAAGLRESRDFLFAG